MEDSNEEVLGARLVNILVVNELGARDQDDAELLFQIREVLLDEVESLSDLLFDLGRLGTVFLDDLFSSVEHVCLSSKLED